MAYSPFVVPSFGGVNLVQDPEEVGASGAADLLNVDVSSAPGVVKTRPGLSQFDTSGGTTSYTGAFPYSPASGSVLLLTRVSGSTVTLDKMTDTTISNIGNWSSGSGTPFVYGAASIGTNTGTFIYLASRATTGAAVEVGLRKYNGSALSTASPASLPAYVASWQFRLVQAHFEGSGSTPSGANGSRHTVFFSDAGAPDTYTSTSWVMLDPGDGDEIVGMASYGNDLYVFKNSHYYHFYGISTAADGSAVFNFRRYAMPARVVSSSLVLPPRNVVAAGMDGVYVCTGRGVYRVNAGSAALVSKPIEPVFAGSGSLYLTSQPDGLFVADERVYLVGGTNLDGSEGRAFVLDTRDASWTMWKFPAKPRWVTSWGHTGASNAAPRTFLVASDSHVYKLLDAATSDYGNAIASYYQSGVYDLGSPGAKAYTRWCRLWGSGAPTVSVLTDHGSSDASAGAVTLGIAPAMAQGYHLRSYRGELFAHKLSATSGAWSVNRFQYDIGFVKP